jgi:hypothetical protein
MVSIPEFPDLPCGLERPRESKKKEAVGYGDNRMKARQKKLGEDGSPDESAGLGKTQAEREAKGQSQADQRNPQKDNSGRAGGFSDEGCDHSGQKASPDAAGELR